MNLPVNNNLVEPRYQDIFDTTNQLVGNHERKLAFSSLSGNVNVDGSAVNHMAITMTAVRFNDDVDVTASLAQEIPGIKNCLYLVVKDFSGLME